MVKYVVENTNEKFGVTTMPAVFDTEKEAITDRQNLIERLVKKGMSHQAAENSVIIEVFFDWGAVNESINDLKNCVLGRDAFAASETAQYLHEKLKGMFDAECDAMQKDYKVLNSNWSKLDSYPALSSYLFVKSLFPEPSVDDY